MSHPYQVFLRALSRAWQEPARFSLALAGMVGIGSIDPMLVLYTREVVDQYFKYDNQASAALGVLLFAGIYFLRGGLVFCTGRIMASLAADVLVNIQGEIFQIKRRRVTSPANTSHLLIALLSEAKQSTDLIEKVIVKYIRSSFNLLALLFTLAYLQPLVGLICVCALLPTTAICVLLGKKYEAAAGAYVGANHDMLTFCSDSAAGIGVLRGLGVQLDIQRENAMRLASLVAASFNKMYSRGGTLVPITQLFLGFALVFLVFMVQGGMLQVDAGTLTALVTNFVLLHSPLRDLAEAHTAVLRGAIGQRWVDNDQPPGSASDMQAGATATTASLLEVERSGGDRRGILLVVAPGEVRVIDGDEGLAIMNCCAAAVRNRAGGRFTLRWRGQNIAALAPEQIGATCFYADSAVPLYDADLATNVACNAAPDPVRVLSALADGGLGAWVESLPAGIDSLIGTNGIRLSGGQRQLLALARAFYLRSPVVLLNDPTSALDSESEQRFCQALRKLAHGSAVLVWSHRAVVQAISECESKKQYA